MDLAKKREASADKAGGEAKGGDDDGEGKRDEHGRVDLGRTRVIQRRFNVSVPRARVPEKASTLRDRSER